MKNKFFLLVFLSTIFLSLKCNSQPGAAFAVLDKNNHAVVGKNITIKSAFENSPLVEPHVSAHPADNDFLLVAAMVVTDINDPYHSCRLSSFVSEDGGMKWKETAHDWWGYDPWTAILPNGQTAMSWLGTPGRFQHEFPVQFFSSNDGGKNWNQKTQTFEGGHDGTKITALGNEFYFTTVRFRGHGVADVVLYRREGAGEFSEVAKIDAKGKRLNFCEPAILSDGTVVVPASHFMKKIWVQIYHPQKDGLSEPHNFSLNPGGARGYMRLVADTGNNSPFKDRIYFVRAMGAGEGAQGVLLNYSSDKGKTWSTDTRIDLFEKTGQSKAMVASAAVNKQGFLGISWVDSQDESAQQKNDVYFALSIDGGTSFQRPVKITDISSDPRTEGNGDVANKFAGGGHYLGLTAKADGSFQLVWSDSRNGYFELQTCNVVVGQ